MDADDTSIMFYVYLFRYLYPALLNGSCQSGCEDPATPGPQKQWLWDTLEGSPPPYLPQLATGKRSTLPQATQTEASEALLDDTDLLTQLYRCLGGIPLGVPRNPAKPKAFSGRHRSLT